MSYARFSDGDVYVFMHVDGFLECCGCLLNDECLELPATAQMVDHLREHVAAGHRVPDYVIPGLERDDAENFPDRAVNGTSP
jgi:hypothetical protein